MNIRVASVQEIPSGTMKTVVAGGRKLAIANIGGEFFAVDDTCTHEECSLGSEGLLDVGVIMCGCHGAQFDVTNGKVLSLPATRDLHSYAITVSGEDLIVMLTT